MGLVTRAWQVVVNVTIIDIIFFTRALRVNTRGLHFLFLSLFKFDAKIDLKCLTEKTVDYSLI